MTFDFVRNGPVTVLEPRQGRSALWLCGPKALGAAQHIQCAQPGIITLLRSWNQCSECYRADQDSIFGCQRNA